MEMILPSFFFEYQCAECLENFTKGRSDEIAIKEFMNKFQRKSLQNTIMVCEECYRKLIREKVNE
jgi:hypothetical protein